MVMTYGCYGQDTVNFASSDSPHAVTWDFRSTGIFSNTLPSVVTHTYDTNMIPWFFDVFRKLASVLQGLLEWEDVQWLCTRNLPSNSTGSIECLGK